MRRELLMRCSCGSEILALTSWVLDPNDEEECWIEIVMTYKPRGLRHRLRAFLGRYDEAVILEPGDMPKLRAFLADTPAPTTSNGEGTP